MIIRMIIYHTYDWSRPYDHTSYAATEDTKTWLISRSNTLSVDFGSQMQPFIIAQACVWAFDPNGNTW